MPQWLSAPELRHFVVGFAAAHVGHGGEGRVLHEAAELEFLFEEAGVILIGGISYALWVLRRWFKPGYLKRPSGIVAAVVAFLCSDRAGRITGQSIPVAGGISRHL